MGFVMGLLTGLVFGAVGAVLYSVQTGRDLRDEFEQVRSDVQRRDFDALGGRLEERFKELQGSLEERIGQARDSARRPRTTRRRTSSLQPKRRRTPRTRRPREQAERGSPRRTGAHHRVAPRSRRTSQKYIPPPRRLRRRLRAKGPDPSPPTGLRASAIAISPPRGGCAAGCARTVPGQHQRLPGASSEVRFSRRPLTSSRSR